MRKVLIVDDEPDILLMLRINLEDAGFATTLAADGETALARIENERPDLVLLDVMMPVMDGWAVLERLRTRGDSPPVVILSARTTGRDVLRALELGAIEYLTKPFDPEVLVATIARVLDASPEERERRRLTRLMELGG